MQPALANDFQAAILAGNFDKAISLLDHLIQSSNTLKQVCFRCKHICAEYLLEICDVCFQSHNYKSLIGLSTSKR